MNFLECIKMEKYKILIILNIILRIPLLFLTPISLFGDGLLRFIAHSYELISLNLSFVEPPFFFLIEGGLSLIFSGRILEFFWKVPSFLFFVSFLFLLPSIYRILKLNEKEKLIITALLLFSTHSLLYGSSIMMEMLVLFFAFSIFILIEKTKTMGRPAYFILAILAALMIYTKQTGLFVLMGLILYVFFKDIPIKQKISTGLSLILGYSLYLVWVFKNSFLNIHAICPIKECILIPFFNFFVIKNLIFNISISVSETYHRFWFIPLFEQINPVKLTGFLSFAYLNYYIIFIILTLIISFAIIFGAIKFRKSNFKYLVLISPLCGFALLWGFFSGRYLDFGRYLFSFHLFFYFFAAKFIESIKKEYIKKFFYLIIILLVILFTITAYATVFRMQNKDNQIRQIAEVIKYDDFKIVQDSSFARATLGYYTKKHIGETNGINEKCRALKDEIFESKNYQIFLKNKVYYVCET